jgi:hypothetical protein
MPARLLGCSAARRAAYCRGDHDQKMGWLMQAIRRATEEDLLYMEIANKDVVDLLSRASRTDDDAW